MANATTEEILRRASGPRSGVKQERSLSEEILARASGKREATGQTVGGVAKSFVGGLGRGALDILDLASGALSIGTESAASQVLSGQVPPIDRAVEAGRSGLASLGLSDEPKGTTERFARNLGEAAPGAALGGAAAIRSGFAKRLGGPLRSAISEGFSAVGEAVGRTFAQENFPESPGVEMFLGISGSVTAGLGGGTLRNIRDLNTGLKARRDPAKLEKLSPIAQEAGKDRVGRIVQQFGVNADGSLDSVKSHLDEAIRLSEEIEDFVPTSAQASRSPGIITLEKLSATSDAPFTTTVLARKAQTDMSVLGEVRRRTPIGDEQSLRIQIADRTSQILEQMESVVDDAVDRVSVRVNDATSGVDVQDATSRALGVIAEERARVMEPIHRGYERLLDLADERDVRVVISDPDGLSTFSVIRDWAKKIRGIARKSLPSELIDDIQDMGPRPPFRRVWSLRRAINDELGREGITKTQKQFLMKLKAGVDADLARFEGEGVLGHDYAVKAKNVFSDQSRAATTLRKLNAARAEVGQRFDDGVTGLTLSHFRGKFPEKATLAAFFRAGDGGDLTMQRYLGATRAGNASAFPSAGQPADLPEARKLMRSYITSRAIAYSLDDTGSIALDGRRLARFRNNHSQALSQFPDADADLLDIRNLQLRVDKSRGSLVARRQDLEKEAATILLNKPVETAFNQVFQAGTPIQQAKAARELLKQVGGDERAVAGLQRVFWEELTSRLSNRIARDTSGVIERVNPSTLFAMVRQNKDAIRILFGEDHLRFLVNDALPAAEIAKATTRPVITGVNDLSLIENVRWRALIAPIYGPFQRGVRGAEAAGVLIENLSSQHRLTLMREALLNPKTMRLLMDRKIPARIFVRRVRANLATLGIHIDEKGKPEESEREKEAKRIRDQFPSTPLDLVFGGARP